MEPVFDHRTFAVRDDTYQIQDPPNSAQMVNANLEQWFEVRAAKKQMPLEDHYAKIQEQHAYQMASLVTQHMEWQGQEAKSRPATEPPSSQPGSPPELVSSQETEDSQRDSSPPHSPAYTPAELVPSRETDDGTWEQDFEPVPRFVRLRDIERMEEEERRARVRAEQVKRISMSVARPIPMRHGFLSQADGSYSRESQPRASSADAQSQPTRDRETARHRDNEGPSTRQVTQGPTPFELKIMGMIKAHVAEFNSEMRELRKGHDDLAEQVKAIRQNICGTEQDRHTRLLAKNKAPASRHGQERRHQGTITGRSRQIPQVKRESVLPGVKKDEDDDDDEEEEEEDEFPDPAKLGTDQARTSGSASAGQKRKALGEQKGRTSSKKRPPHVLKESPVPNPHRALQDKLTNTFGKGGSKNPWVLA
ncbi:hypothetical protein B0H66DRAFT_601418 [Apodospora peruviana]|uniref:Uncharacterized protein n=1 Tax=Apodospora peruviana TaxID=516989 RepID=A0AAE0IB96_9PEZI|nr:hypothetical protein B0H66DRAFT_601418 [Apodospora peruviana]